MTGADIRRLSIASQRHSSAEAGRWLAEAIESRGAVADSAKRGRGRTRPTRYSLTSVQCYRSGEYEEQAEECATDEQRS